VPLLTTQTHCANGYIRDLAAGIEWRDGGELLGIFDRIFDRKDDKPPEARPDFSNVSSGGSS